MVLGQTKRVGKQTVQFEFPPSILAMASVVGPMEGKGPLGDKFDKVAEDNLYGEQSWEKAERKMMKEAVQTALSKAGLELGQINYLLAGDLLNQIISANFAARDLGIPLIGLYGACSTMFEGLALGAMLIDGGYATNVAIAASSHHDTAERQYRYPTELGVQRPMSAQWTVTGAGAAMLGDSGSGPVITHATIGKVVDLGITDAADMGSAMAPAAASTICQHFRDTGRTPEDYDLIISGDLASVGKALTQQLAAKENYDLTKNYTDCGVLIYDSAQDTHAGGSGCACGATVFGSFILEEMKAGKYKRVLAIGTGALLSPTTALQGETIPGIAHAVAVEIR